MTPISQYNAHACVAACLESFLRDLGRDFSHERFIKENLDLFHGGEEIEGACNTSNFAEVAKRLGLSFHIPKEFDFQVLKDDSAVFLFIYQDGDENSRHFVRFAHEEDGNIFVMNPLKPDLLERVPFEWIKNAYVFSFERTLV